MEICKHTKKKKDERGTFKKPELTVLKSMCLERQPKQGERDQPQSTVLKGLNPRT